MIELWEVLLQFQMIDHFWMIILLILNQLNMDLVMTILSKDIKNHLQVNLLLHPRKVLRGKKITSVDILVQELKNVKYGMDAVATSFSGSISNHQSEKQLYEEILKIDDMGDMSLMIVYSARAFLALPEERRRLWLMVEFGDSLFDA
ncbi:hypothetical protein PanWU01x14_243680 [Parasponia andersonii]|uniref:Uncharacterized protein n=1 Tax=Parasponia andersonii TaxID=3476 RepID=A0A2P5BFD9_PARAD|nr:hypothetical protein PanWU01x14_243680 [Parasponia andersonii]